MVGFNILIIFIIGIIITLYKGIKIVPQGQEWIIEKLGKFNRTLDPGLNLIVPFDFLNLLMLELLHQYLSLMVDY